MTNLTYDYFKDVHSFYDLNHDGFKDFLTPYRRGADVFLFDTSQQEFYPNPVSIAFESWMIDSVRQLYIEYDGKPGAAYTTLFRLEGFKQVLLYHARINEIVSEDSETTTLRLYKVNKGALNDTVYLNQKTFDLSEFDTERYWRNVIRKYGLRN